MRSKVIKCEVFKAEVLFVWDCNYKELEKNLKRRGIIGQFAELEDLANADGSQPTFTDEKTGDVFRVLWLKQWKGKPDDYGILAHEITHLVVRIMDWKGIPFDGVKNNDETFAYLVDYFVREFLKIV